MSSASRLSRLLALVPWLMVNDGITIAEAAVHFGVSPAQLEKDLWLLIVCGLPGHGPDQLVDIQFWDDGRIHVIDAQTMNTPLRLSGDEAVALLVALRLLAQIPGDHDREALLRATHRLQEAVGELGEAPAVVVQAGGDTSVIDVLNDAIQGNLGVRIVYGSATRDEVTEREIEPLRIASDDGRTYVEAMCRRAGARRTFRLDRILSAALTTSATADMNSAEEGAQHDLTSGAPLVPSESVKPLSAVIAIDSGARWVLDILSVTDVDDSAESMLTGTVHFYDPEWLVRMMLSLGGVAEVLAPAELRKSVADAANRALAAYAEGP
jgi:proteasome accessory factor C